MRCDGCECVIAADEEERWNCNNVDNYCEENWIASADSNYRYDFLLLLTVYNSQCNDFIKTQAIDHDCHRTLSWVEHVCVPLVLENKGLVWECDVLTADFDA